MTAVGIPPDIKTEVRAFYDSIGWQQVGEGLYQNAGNEDLRPVSRQYIQRCHRRVRRHLQPSGRFLLDAGSGPIQYPEYLEYSEGYARRVCLDLSRRALSEARLRIGEHGLFVRGDLAALPFRRDSFDGVVSLHALHHLPAAEQEAALAELIRVAAPGRSAAVVYSWGESSGLMAAFRPLLALVAALRGLRLRLLGKAAPTGPRSGRHLREGLSFKHDFEWMVATLTRLGGGEILVWRSVSTAFLRGLVHRRLFGRSLLQLLFALEESAPHWFGRHGTYPLIVLLGGGAGPAPAEGIADSRFIPEGNA